MFFFLTWPKNLLVIQVISKDLLVIQVISKAIKTCDTKMNMHNDLKDNYGQLKKIKIYIYILITHKKNFKFITHS